VRCATQLFLLNATQSLETPLSHSRCHSVKPRCHSGRRQVLPRRSVGDGEGGSTQCPERAWVSQDWLR